MEKNRNCSACNVELDNDNYKKNGTICKNCYNEKKRRKKNSNALIRNQQPKIDIVNNNNRSTLLVSPSFPDKTYLLFKIISRITLTEIFTQSPNQHTNIIRILKSE